MSKKDDSKPHLNPNEMAFRKPYQELLLSGGITTVFRPGKRLPDDTRGYRPGQLVTARVIDRLGLDWKFIPPKFVPDIAHCIRISEVYSKDIDSMDRQDFMGSGPDIFDSRSLRYHLGLIYNMDINSLKEVTVIKFTHGADECVRHAGKYSSVPELVRAGIAELAEQPKDNREQMKGLSRYTVSFIEHDYPARTPSMWNAAYRAFGMTDIAHMMYAASAGNIHDIVNALRSDPMYLGGGFGVGFKDEVVAYVDTVEPITRKIGAANIVVKDPDGRLTAYNTDGFGYVSGLETVLSGKPLSACKVVIIGAGGTANAIAFSLAKKGARVVILNRTVEKAEALAERVNHHFELFGDEACRAGNEERIHAEAMDADVIVNASTKGASGKFEDYIALAPVKSGDDSVIINHREAREIMRAIPKTTVISDVVLREKDTPLISLAKELGYPNMDGIPMVVYQGVEAFWLVHGKELSGKGISKESVFPVMKKAAGF